MNEKEIRQQIKNLVEQLYNVKFKNQIFNPGIDKINYAGRIFDQNEMIESVDNLLDFTLTFGTKSLEFERKFAQTNNSLACVLTNSGSSANLLAISTLASKQKENRLLPGDKIITPATTFPTTLAPILQNNFKPIFGDIDPETYNIDDEALKEAAPKAKAMFLAHTLGNINNMDLIKDLQKDHNLILIEDCCDAVGGTYDNKIVGTFGEMGTVSFFPAHHMTLGEGGAILTNNVKTLKILKSLREWGRDCWCIPGQSNTCGKRFSQKFGELPVGYDHKYVYSEIGYNLKTLDLQAAIGLEQLKKLPTFIEKRKNNFKTIYNHLKQYQDKILLPKWHQKADPSWFAFPITVKEPENRDRLRDFLESKKIETRMIFAGNILKQPAYTNIERDIVGDLKNTDNVMNNSFFIGVYPGITQEKLKYILNSFDEYFQNGK